MDVVPDLSLDELARIHLLRAPQLMWLLRAGTSAAVVAATARQIIDELAEPGVRKRVQRILDQTLGGGDPDEYAELRRRAGLATVGVAERLGMHTATYRRLERGRTPLPGHRRHPGQAMTTQRQPTITEIRRGNVRHHLSDTEAGSDLDSPPWEPGVR